MGRYIYGARSEDGDRVSVISSIVEAVDGADLDRFVDLLVAPETAIVTITVTEAGYRLTAEGLPNLSDPAVVADLARLQAIFVADPLPESYVDGPSTTLGRLVLGLEARRRAGVGPIAVVPCDNMPANGQFVATGLTALALTASAETAEWIAQNVSFVSTSVDRITPKTTPDVLATAAALSGWNDNAAVVTEPFKDWVLCGEFPGWTPSLGKRGRAIRR